jgi:hypothetical protein
MPESAVVRERLRSFKAQLNEMHEATEARRQAMKIAAADDLAERLALLSRQAQSQADSPETTWEDMPT